MQPETEQQTRDAGFERQMEVAREIMTKDFSVLRAFADLDRTGHCTLDGKTYGEAEIRALGAELKANSARPAS